MEEKNNKIWFNSYPNDVKRTIERPNKSIYNMLQKTAEEFGDRIALIPDHGQEINYKQLKEMVDRLATSWYEMGFQKGERIGLMLPNTPYYIISYYAALKLGLIVVQINPNYTVRELLKILNNSGTKYLVTAEESLQSVNQVREMHPLNNVFITESKSTYEGIEILSELIKISKPKELAISIDAENDVAVIQYTGGTTGNIKGAMLTHSNLVANVLQSHAIYGDKMGFGTEIVLTATPLYHVYAMTSAMNLGIYIAATNILMEQYEVNRALEKIKKYQPSYFPGVPRMYNDFIHHPSVEDYGLSCFKFCSCGSAPLPIEVINKFENLTGAYIAEGFGLTEASPSTHRNPPFGVRKIGSIGIPLPGTDCKIVDEAGKELPPNTIGELIVKGPQVMKGYWNDEEETVHSLRDGWLYTADLANQDEEGYFYIVGRKVEMIISNGFNVYPQEVENILYEHPDVKETAVVGIPDEKMGEIVKAFVVPKEGITVSAEELKGHCYRDLTPYKVPREFEIIEKLPRNNVGKILKNKLVEMDSNCF